jgi:hypothetical protein
LSLTDIHQIAVDSNRIGQCLDEITPQACANYFAKAGYAPS